MTDERMSGGFGPMTDLDELLKDQPTAGPSLTGAKGKVCTRHQWVQIGMSTNVYGQPIDLVTECARCHKIRDEARRKRGATSRSYGNRAELKVARTYGGQKIGHAGGPVDVRGKDFDTQVKTHRRRPPTEWITAFNAMRDTTRIPRMLLRFVKHGQPPEDYFVFKASDFLDWFGKDE